MREAGRKKSRADLCQGAIPLAGSTRPLAFRQEYGFFDFAHRSCLFSIFSSTSISVSPNSGNARGHLSCRRRRHAFPPDQTPNPGPFLSDLVRESLFDEGKYPIPPSTFISNAIEETVFRIRYVAAAVTDLVDDRKPLEDLLKHLAFIAVPLSSYLEKPVEP